MFSKKTKIITFYIFLSIITVTISFTVALMYFNSDSSSKENIANTKISKSVSSNVNDITIRSSTKIQLKILYTKSGNTSNSFLDNTSLIGKTLAQVKEIYSVQGYKIEKFTLAEVILTKSEEKYSQDKYVSGKYVLGIKDGFIAIFRADSVGKLYIEDAAHDTTEIKTTNLKQADIDMLYRGDLQFNSRVEAEGSLEDYR
ncbi:MAG TPA: hypothetical protein VIK72_16475 [Clostridiaceae bacterium]